MLFRRSRTITPAEALERHGRGELVLVDVREPDELRAGRIKGARNVPLGQLPARLGELDRDTAVAFVCQSGARSAGATRVAARAGYDAYNVRGGVLAWSRAGLPLTR
ncbi:MAG TPA: rhodanese-like domain-containing protein [Baekduia sp.]|nr:rhodanese-like domain-containing protein [Baekduia sp.]